MQLKQKQQYARYVQPARKPGPVTGAFNVITRADRARPARFMLRAWPAVPLLALLRALLLGRVAWYADEVLGYDALLCLVATLAITPLVTTAGAKITTLRVWYGLWMFGIGVLAVAVHLGAAHGHLAASVAGTAVAWTGLMIVVLMLPMAVSSGKR
jgi:hypothetical protein